MRSFLYPTDEMMEKYFDSMTYWMAKIEECRHFSQYPMNGNDYTCNWCKYRPLCEAPQLEEQFVEEGVFKKDGWEPY